MAQSSSTKVDAEQLEEWKTEADSVWQFGLLAAPNLGEYGGGDGLKLAMPLLVMKLPNDRIPAGLLSKLPDHINQCIAQNNSIPKDKRVARLPEHAIDANDIVDTWHKTCHFELQSHVLMASSNRYNLMYQGWLFRDIPNDPNRLGCSLFPLVGVYQPHGCIQFTPHNKLDANDESLHYAGYNQLNWADQHCHLDFGAWHFGSDMSKIIVDLSCKLVRFWSVCVDTDNRKIDVSLIYIVDAEQSANIEGLLRECNPLQSKQKAVEFYQLFTAVFDDEFASMKDEKSVLSKLLFGCDINAAAHVAHTEQKQDAAQEEEAAMKQQLQELAQKDKQAKIAHFIANEDAIRDIKDASSPNLIAPHAHNAKPETDEQAEVDEEAEIKRTLQELATKDKNRKLEQFISNEDAIRQSKEVSVAREVEPHAHGEQMKTEDDAEEADEEEMKDALAELVTTEKQIKLQQFIANEDAIRTPKYNENEQQVEIHGHSEELETEMDVDDEEEMKEKLQELATQEKNRKILEYTDNEDAIRSVKDKSSDGELEVHAHNFNDVEQTEVEENK